MGNYSWFNRLPENVKKGFKEWFDEYERDYYEEDYGHIDEVTDLPEDELSYLFWDEGEFDGNYVVEYRNMRTAVHEILMAGDDRDQAEAALEILKRISDAERDGGYSKAEIYAMWDELDGLNISYPIKVDYRTVRNEPNYIFVNSENEIPDVWA